VRDRHEQQLAPHFVCEPAVALRAAFALAFSLTWEMHKLFVLDCSFGR
jgi:hypothetical protein